MEREAPLVLNVPGLVEVVAYDEGSSDAIKYRVLSIIRRSAGDYVFICWSRHSIMEITVDRVRDLLINHEPVDVFTVNQ